MRALVVLPTYQEAENVVEILGRLRAAVPGADVLVVDDASPDGTADVAKVVGHDLGGVDVWRRAGKLGHASACREGFTEGLARGYDVVVQMDADLSHDPAALPTLLGAIEAGADMVIGSRYVPGGSVTDWSAHRRVLSRWGNRYAGWALRLSIRDATSGYRVFTAALLRAVDVGLTRADGYCFQIELVYEAARSGARIVELPIEFRDRARGRSKMSARIVVEALALVTRWGLRDRLARRRSR